MPLFDLIIVQADTVTHNHKHGCSKCTVFGKWNDVTGTTVYADLEATNRLDVEFRNKHYLGKHQKGIKPLLELPIDMINDLPIGDSLHLLDYGVTKRLLIDWVVLALGNIDAKWSRNQFAAVSDRLASFKAPAEIRALLQVRDLHSLKHWKAIEFQIFELYYGIAALKNIMPDYIYIHFILYFCAYTISSYKSPMMNYFEIGKKCLDVFLERIFGTIGR